VSRPLVKSSGSSSSWCQRGLSTTSRGRSQQCRENTLLVFSSCRRRSLAPSAHPWPRSH
jgi:hypothetical protein